MDSCVANETISAPMRLPTRVVALRQRDHATRFELSDEPRKWVVGKSPTCDLVIDDPFVSGVHCVIERKLDGSVVVRDCESKNGTIIDGAPVLAVPLRPGAAIVVGKTWLVAVGEDTPESALVQLRGHDPRFRDAIDLGLRAARSECSVLVLGETGTGKELVARAIHEASRRAAGPFVAVNCGAIPRELIGAELFGHMRGAFTGADAARDGLFLSADAGTLFLDEIGELARDQQPHLLRALETRRVRPLGGVAERAFDVRFVSATNCLDLGSPGSPLRFDLYQRIAAVIVTLPPLRARKDDILELAEHFLAELAVRHGPRRLLGGAIDALMAYPWPGNVRELRQAMIRAVALTHDDITAPDLFLPQVLVAPYGRGGPRVPPVPHNAMLKDLMERALARHGTIRAAAKEVGMPKSTFAEKARKFGLLRGREDDEG